jgi:thymidylate kinase
MGKLIVFEGADGVGKGTLSRALVNKLVEKGIKAVRVEPTKESHPQGCKAIYGMLESGAARSWPSVFQLVQFLNRMYFQFFKLPKLLRENDLVILDRWSLSGYIYGRCAGVNSLLNNLMYWCAKKADMVLIVCGKSYRRAAANDSYERDVKLQQAVEREYLLAALERPQHVCVFNDGPISQPLNDVLVLLYDANIIS